MVQKTKMNMIDYIDKLDSKGYDCIGSGSYGSAHAYKNKKNVLKVFTQDEPYLKFIEKIKQSKNPYFPRIKSIKHYKGSNKYIYTVVELERLTEFDDLCISAQDKILDMFGGYVDDVDYKASGYGEVGIIQFNEVVRSFRDSYDRELNEALNILMDLEDIENECELDCHGENIMIRKEGKTNRLVFTDPLWTGF